MIDRNTLLENPLQRTEDIIDESRQYIINKFGKNGYATEKMYFEDLDYKKFLEDISILVENKDEFKNRYCEVNYITSRANKV